jgi:translation elongation factor EF-G
MSSFNNEFKNKSPENLIKDYRKQLSSNIDSVRNELKTVSDELFKKTCEKFESVLKDSAEVYENEMKASLITNFKSNIFRFSLTEIDDQNRKVSTNFFEKSAQELNNWHLFKKYSTQLSENLNKIKTKYSTALESIKNYRSQMDKKYVTYRYVPLKNLMEIHIKLKEKTNVSLEILEDQELKDIVINALDSIIESIKRTNQMINDNEEEIADEVISFIYALFHKRFDSVLKSGLFFPTSVHKMHQKLLEYSLDKMTTYCDFKEYQKHSNDKCVNELTN